MEILHVNKENFKEKIIEYKGKVLLDLWAPWCGPCRMLAPVLEQVASEVNDVIIAKCNIDENIEIAQAYNVQSIPTLLLFEDGKVINKIIGFTSKDNIIKFIK